MAILSKKKLVPLPTLVKKADKVFSRWIRDRDVIDGLYIETEDGLSIPATYCFTCLKKIPISGKGTGEAGHFIKRGVKTLRYNPENVHTQCSRCNHFLGGNDGKYAVNLNRLYGQGKAEELIEIESIYKRDGHKFTRQELENVIANFS